MSMLNSFSNSMTSSTMSRLSAPRSSMKLASSVSFSRSTPSSFSMMSFTFSVLSAMTDPSWLLTMCGSWENNRSRARTLHHHAAVDHQHLAGDVRRVLRSEKDDERCNIGRSPETAERDLRRRGSSRFGGHGGGHFGFDETG